MENQIPQREMPLNEEKGECDRSKSIAPSPTSPNSTLRTPLRYPNKPTASVFLNTTRRRILLAHAEKPAQKKRSTVTRATANLFDFHEEL